MARRPTDDTGRTKDPDQTELGRLQAARLSDIVGEPAEKLAGRSYAALHEELRWRIEPQLLMLRRICGRVVRRNPETGALEGVPNATVHVEDTDCSFLFYNPSGWTYWSWLYPFNCRREVIATTVTDECGRFCVWIPAWEIDWILRWRRVRRCFPTFFRPRLRDVIERDILPEILRVPDRVGPPIPPGGPLSGSLSLASGGCDCGHDAEPRMDAALRRTDAIDRLREFAGPQAVERIAALARNDGFGAGSGELGAELETPTLPLPPPLPEGLDGKELRREIGADLPDDLRQRIGKIDLRRYVGPFWRCVDVFLPVWSTVLDVPDITFRVTQDVDADGDEETIYSEGYFDVRWNSGAMPSVLLEAGPNAISTPNCDGPDIGRCESPTILTAGLMPLDGPHFDTGDGYARFVNRARSGGTSSSARDLPTTAPMLQTVQLHGCHRFDGAQHYRILRSYGGGSFTPVQDESWYAPRLGPGAPFHIVPDADGWYPILPEGDLVFPHWLLNWRTWRYPDGRHDMRLELGDGSKNPIDQSPAVPIRIDNSAPVGAFTSVEWRHAGGGWTALPTSCPVIRRQPGLDVELRVTCSASASHYRSAWVFATSCGGDALPRLDADSAYDNWHTGPADNSWSTTARFLVGQDLDDGAYTVGINVYGRAFNPAGGDTGPSSGWDYDWVYAATYPRRSIAIVDL